MWWPAREGTIEASIYAGPQPKIPPGGGAMYPQLTIPLDDHKARYAGDYDAATLEALRTFLADLAWSDQGE